MTDYYVYSTLASPVSYNVFAKAGADMPVIDKSIVIAGGAGVATKNLVTPRGVMTKVSEEELTLLRQNTVFQLHEKNGFMNVEKKQADPEVVAADMTGRDNSAPLVPEDFEEEKAPTTNKGKNKK